MSPKPVHDRRDPTTGLKLQPCLRLRVARDWNDILSARVISVIRPCVWLSLGIRRIGLSDDKRRI